MSYSSIWKIIQICLNRNAQIGYFLISLNVVIRREIQNLKIKSDAGAFWVSLVTTLEFMGGASVVVLEVAWTDTQSKKDYCST